MPVVSASSRMPARISSSVTASIAPPVRRASSSAYGPSAGLPMASDLAIVSGLHRPADVLAGVEGRRDRRAALRLGAVHDRRLAVDEPERAPLVEALGDLREQRAGGDRRDAAVGQLPAELLGDLVGQRLRALGVVRPHVDVDERPVALARQLGAQPVDVVVVAAHLDQVRAVHPGGQDLLLLEVGRDEDVGLHAQRRAVGGDRVGQVAGRRAGQHLEAELAGAGAGDRDDAVLERVRRVGGVVLDPHLAQAEALGQAVGADQRRAARGQARARARLGALAAAGSRRSARCSAARPGCGGAGPATSAPSPPWR